MTRKIGKFFAIVDLSRRYPRIHIKGGLMMANRRRESSVEFYTREHLVHDTDEEIIRARRYVKPLSIQLISTNWNGEGNHRPNAEEEKMLTKQMVELFSQNVRAIDKVYLYQKGILAILLPETDKVQALSTAKRLQSVVQQGIYLRRNQADGVRVKPTLCIGIASYPWDASSADEMFNGAKLALDEAVVSGRGRICFLDFEYQHVRGSQPLSYKIRSV